jgi:3-deoxy-manno-octulosonate cytidylyltransferase (CMP-KDO synthetase)
MKTVALIPARMGATRFPAKLVADLCGKPLIARTYLSTVETGVFDEVMVVTDHQDIAEIIEAEGGRVFLSQQEHESGSDRIAEAVKNMDAEVVVNVQGDEPFQDRKSLQNLVEVFNNNEVEVASMMSRIVDPIQVDNPNVVKVVVDKHGFALYFSRSPLPYRRNPDIEVPVYKHIGIYAYRRQALVRFTELEKSQLERVEMLEQLRLLENGIRIKMIESNHQAVAVDTEQDLEKARAYYRDHSRG